MTTLTQDRMVKIRKIASKLSGPYAALLVLFIVCSVSSDVFLSADNLLNILRQVSYSGLIALGMTFVIVAGGIDLSVGSLFAFCGVCSILAIRKFTPEAPVMGISPDVCGFLVAAVCCIAAGLLGGAVNGAVIIFGKIPPFIATLGAYSIFRSLALFLADSGTLSTNNQTLCRIGEAEIGPISLPALLLFLLTLLLGLLLSATSFGKHVCAVGSSERVARFAGIPTGRVQFMTYLIIGVCVGIAALLFAGRLGSVSSSNAGLFYELDAIAAVIIGGAAMSGGRGTLHGTLAGILILGLVSNILDMWGIAATLQGLVKGLVIIISVLIQRKDRQS